MLTNIPAELRALPQWVVAGDDKLPYNPRTKKVASVVEPSTWGTFEEAVKAGFRYIGFVLTPADPYAIVDLDDKPDRPISDETRSLHHRILTALDSYTERSASGRGYHIITRGSIPSGVHRDSVEIYSSGRYMICTGDVVRDSPIRDYNAILNTMYGQMKPPEVSELIDEDGWWSDNSIVTFAMTAANAEKFNSLCAGDMAGYPSQSEADFALLSIIAYYTQDNAQVRRIFRHSSLGQRDKAVRNNDYINFALGKIRGQQSSAPNLSEVEERAKSSPVTELLPPAISPPVNAVPDESYFPPGLVGDIANYILKSAFMPVKEVALAAAITFVGAIAGRQYNFGKQGLSQYVVLLAPTGTGKEGAASGLDRLFAGLRRTIPMVDELRGPAAFASGPAVIRAIAKQPSMLSIQGEFGFTINRLNNAKPGSPESTLKQALMDIYTKSGWGSTIQSTVYSDQERNTASVGAPNLNILGESTQVKFFEGLDITASEDGLIPRLLLIEFTGNRPYPNWSHGFSPDPSLMDRLNTLVACGFAMRANNQCYEVPMDSETEELYRSYTHACLDHMNASSNSSTAVLKSRSAAMTTRIAALVAVGVNFQNPVVTKREFLWAKSLVERSVRVLESRFNTGDIGDGDAKQIADLRSIVELYYTRGWQQVKDFVQEEDFKKGILPYRYLLQRTANRSAFKNDRIGATNALRRCIQVLNDTEELVELASGPGRPGKAGAKNFGLGPHWKWSKK